MTHDLLKRQISAPTLCSILSFTLQRETSPLYPTKTQFDLQVATCGNMFFCIGNYFARQINKGS
jgi:hypothetical protein